MVNYTWLQTIQLKTKNDDVWPKITILDPLSYHFSNNDNSSNHFTAVLVSFRRHYYAARVGSLL